MENPFGSTFGDPSLARTTAADEAMRAQPFSRPLGSYTGAPPRTRFSNVLVAPLSVGQATRLVEETRENRFVTLIAPAVAATVYVLADAGASVAMGIPLPPGLPYEVSLPGNQELYAITDAAVYLRVRVQVAAALTGDLERRL
jgi:hypothetical protein